MTARLRLFRTLAALSFVATATGTVSDRAAGAATDRAPGAPTNLRVDEARAPLWVTGDPTFGWIPSDPDRNETQTAYRIVVRFRPLDPTKVGRVVWDSGRVSSSAEAFVAAPGLQLESDQGYSWTVQTWDRAGRRGPFAQTQSFDTALGNGDWDADWVRPSVPSTNPFEDYFLVRKAFALGSDRVVRARAYLSAGQQYQLYVDGVRVGSGPSYAYPDQQYYEVTDITKYLKSGRTNVIAMIVHNLGGGQGRPAAPPGVIAHVTIEHRSGGRQTIVTNGTWAWHAGPWLPAAPRNDEGDFVESIDARKLQPDWASAALDDPSWQRVDVIGPHPVEPWTDLVPQRTRIVEEPVKPVTFRRLANGAYVADFGSVIAATPSITLHAGKAGRKLTLRQGFLLEPDGSVSATHGTQSTDMHDDYIERDGAQTVRPFGYLGFRYLELTDPQEPLTASDVIAYARHAEMPSVDASSFSSSSATLNRVWELARRSALYGSQEQFIDTPTREKGQFVRDAANISSVTMIAFGERALTWQGLRDFARSQKKFWPDGRVNAVYPNSDDGRDIPDFTEDYVAWVLHYYEQTGDRATLAALYPTLAKVAGYVARAIVPEVGLVANLPGGGGDYEGGIVDWPRAMRYGYDKSSPVLTTVNILGIEVFREVAAAAKALHRPASEVKRELSRATALTRAVNARLRRTDGVYVDGLHQDGTKSPHASQQANAYALAAGIVPARDRAVVVRTVVHLGMAMGPDVAGVLLAALHDSGSDQAVVNVVSNAKIPGWAQILARGATFTWESWNARDVSGDSESHAWGSTVLTALTTDILGARVTTPGAGRVEVVPPRTNIASARGRLATERGPITVSWHRTDAKHFALDVTVPDNVVATVQLPAARTREIRERDRRLGSDPGVTMVSGRRGAIRVSVGSGHYSFSVAPHPRRQPNLTLVIAFGTVVLLAAIALIAEGRRRSSSLA